MQSLTYVIGKDKRNLVDDIQNFKIDFDDSNYNWVQARQYEDGMRQVFVTMKNEDGSPFDLTGCNYWFEGILPDGVHKILDANHGVAIDPVNGQFRFDMPKQAFSVAGSYVQAFFRIMKDGASITTLEFDLQVLADKVISGLVPRDYITPFEDLLDSLNKMGADTQTMLQNLQKQTSDLEAKITQDGLFTQAEADALKQQLLTIVNGLQAKWHDIEVIDYKPTRDGNAHVLSESYASVDEAQKDYPAATSLVDTKDWCAITEAIKEGQKQGRDIYLAPGNYFVNKTIKLPTGVKFYGNYQNSRIYASQQMSEDSKKTPLAILEYDDSGQPPIYLDNIQVLGTNDINNQLIGLHLGGNRASKISNFIVSYCYGHGTLVHATNAQSNDVENTTFEHYWQVQSGSFCIESNPEISGGGNITDFAVYDSQITTLDIRDDSQTHTSSPAVEILNDDNKDAVKSVYGIEFTRCFLHAQGNNLVRVVGCHSPLATHSINFDFIKGELHDVHGDLGPGSDKFFLFHLENCWHVMVDNSSQLTYSGASYVEIKRCAFCDIKTVGIADLTWQHNDSMIFTLDKYSYENHIDLIGMDVYLAPGTADTISNPDFGYNFGEANDAMDLFSKMKDEGSDNHITGCQIGQTLTLNNEPQRLHQITNGKIDGLADYQQQGVTSSLIANSVHTKHVLASGTVSPQLALPIQYKRISGFLISFRAIGLVDDLKKISAIAGSQLVPIPTDQNWHVWTGICQTNILQIIGFQAPNNGLLTNDVTIEIEYMHCFMENKIPYYPDFVALPMPTIGEGNY
ncbi:BppU family phage baseplate upper protein [Lactiplantibacillus plantarum]|uniref:BppU family phage baseplate upper protein n=1 Tax=Lactiplantibacillus plantarum TaxID=1590 RepID=UPI003EC005A2